MNYSSSILRSILALASVSSSMLWQLGVVFARGPALSPARALTSDITPNEQFGITNVNTCYREAIGNAEDRSERAKSAGATWDRWPADWDRIEDECVGWICYPPPPGRVAKSEKKVGSRPPNARYPSITDRMSSSVLTESPA
jgi:hypothetical protein